MKRTMLIAAAVLLTALITTPAVAKTHAIIVGYNGVPDGIEGLRELRYADDDAARWAEVLGRTGDVHLLTVLDVDSQRAHPNIAARALPPTPENLARAVAQVDAALKAETKAGEQPTLFFVYSGHGAHNPAGEPFLTLQGGALDRAALYAQIATLPARYTHIVVDACHAAAIVGARGDFFGEEREAEHVDTAAVLDELARPPDLSDYPHVGVLLSASAGEASHEWSEIQSGVFTHEVLSALLGPADINGDDHIEYSEVAAYIAAANREVDDPRAVPTIVARPPAVNARVSLMDVSSLGPALTATATDLGRFTIETSTAVRFADGHVVGANPVRIALPAGRAYLRTDAGEAVIDPTTHDVAFSSLVLGTTTGTKGSLDEALRRGLFAASFGPDYYRGYVDANGLIGVDLPAEPELLRDAPRPERRSVVGSALLWTLAAASATGGVLSTVSAVRAKKDFDATDIQRDAYAAADRYQTHRNRAVLFYGVGVAAALGGVLLFPWHRTPIAMGWSPEHGAFVSFSKNW